MKNFGILFLLISIFIASPALADEKPEWFLCKENADCVAVGGCSIHAVNKSFQNEAQAYYQHQEAAISCPERNEDYRVYCTHRKTSCKKKTWFGGEVDDPQSTCVSADMFCETSLKTKKIEKQNNN